MNLITTKYVPILSTTSTLTLKYAYPLTLGGILPCKFLNCTVYFCRIWESVRNTQGSRFEIIGTKSCRKYAVGLKQLEQKVIMALDFLESKEII